MKENREIYFEPRFEVCEPFVAQSLLNAFSVNTRIVEDFEEGDDLDDWGDFIPYNW